MQVIVIILLIALAIFLLVVLIKHFTTKSRLKTAFINGSCCVYGRKGFGKDVLFAEMIKARNEKYFSNLNYGYDYEHIDIKELELKPNDYHHFINGEIEKVEKNEKLEGHDIYLSDAGIYLPSQFDSYLHKVYPSLPIFYALSRHLYNNGIHANAQALGRIWKALREQADYYILMRKRCLKLPFFIVLFTTEYVRYESAQLELAPMKSTIFNKYSKAEVEQYKARHGDIKNGLLIVPKWHLKYDSRAFHEIIFKNKAPRKENNQWLKNLFKRSKRSEKSSTELLNKQKDTKPKC